MRAYAAIAIVLFAPLASASDQPLAGRRLQLRDRVSRPRAAVLLRSVAIVAPAPATGDDPTRVGAHLVISNPVSHESATLDLPATGWYSPAPGEYRFRNPAASSGGSAARRAAIRDGRLVSVRAPTTGITLDEPSQG